jgi:hypothetical protein
MIVTMAADSRSKIMPRQDLITTQKYPFAGLAMANRNALRKVVHRFVFNRCPNVGNYPAPRAFSIST